MAWHPDPVAVLRSIRLRPCFRQCKRLDPGKRRGWIPPSRAQSRRDVNEGGRKATESRTTDLLRVPTSCSGPFRQDLLSYIVSPQGYPGSYLKPRFLGICQKWLSGVGERAWHPLPRRPSMPCRPGAMAGRWPQGRGNPSYRGSPQGYPGHHLDPLFRQIAPKGLSGEIHGLSPTSPPGVLARPPAPCRPPDPLPRDLKASYRASPPGYPGSHPNSLILFQGWGTCPSPSPRPGVLALPPAEGGRGPLLGDPDPPYRVSPQWYPGSHPTCLTIAPRQGGALRRGKWGNPTQDSCGRLPLT